jgi:hypothetical protein
MARRRVEHSFLRKWSNWCRGRNCAPCTLIEPVYPKGGSGEGGRPPVPLERMLRYRYNGQIDEIERRKNPSKSKIRSRVEHAFWIIKGLFGFTKVRYRGLAKTSTACR